MKQKLYVALVALGIAGCARGQTNLVPPIPEWKATVKILDEAGQPVPGADVTVGYYVPSSDASIASSSKKGRTDTNGLFYASEKSTSIDLFIGAIKAGYYKTRIEYELGDIFQYQHNPERWTPSVTLPLKRIINPIPMYAKRVNLGMPVFDKPVGFDLEIGDWVAPSGKGVKTDITFTGHLAKRAEDDFDWQLIVRFPNAGDGIQTFEKHSHPPGQGSTLRSPHNAPESGYQAEWVKSNSRRPGEPSVYHLDENLNFFFRVRTVLDEKGNVKSAQYGKIYGDFLDFTYYLNPTPNDRNVEFDPNQNLLKKLRSTEQVAAP